MVYDESGRCLMRARLLVIALACTALTCSSDNGATGINVCQGTGPKPALCDMGCKADGDCGGALYCGGGNTCIADCTVGTTMGCKDGFTCGDHGKCVRIGNATDGDGGTANICTGLACQQVTCPNGGSTSVSGTVYDPAGKVPLYNVVVYVPNAPLAALTSGASCDKCNASLSGSPIAATLTDTHGHFKLDNIPIQTEVPLVIQVGKWRKQIKVP